MTLGPEWFVVEQRGFDSSGRPLRATKLMWRVWDDVKEDPLVQPFAHLLTPVQGAFMRGSGASASDGFHDLAGCIDWRTWNLTWAQSTIVNYAFRRRAGGSWRRGPAGFMGGMAEHGHVAIGDDRPQSSGSSQSWSAYVVGGNGLAGPGGDYERRPSPIVLHVPDWVIKEELKMDADVREAFKNVHEHITKSATSIRGEIDELADDAQAGRIAERRRDREAAEKAQAVATRVIKKLGGVQDGLVEVQQLLESGDLDGAKARIALISGTTIGDLKADPDIDGPDNPADRDDR